MPRTERAALHREWWITVPIKLGKSVGQLVFFIAAVVVGIAAGLALECVDAVALAFGTWFHWRR